MSSTNPETRRASVAFAAIDPFIDKNIVLPTEKTAPGKDFVEWGENNAYPFYLLSLAADVPSLRSIINGNVDFITGDEVTILPLRAGLDNGRMNGRGDTIREQVEAAARDWETFGGFALQVIRGLDGSISEIYNIEMKWLRTNRDCNTFWYSEKWDKPGRKDTVVYPAFMGELDWASLTPEEKDRHASSILLVKNTRQQAYPSPVYAAAVKACETERCIDDYHLNAINNGFEASAIINFNQGVPSDEQKEEIENDVNEKFSGHANGGRIMLCWNDNKESAVNIEQMKSEDFGEKYKALSEHVRQQIFTAFRAYPCLFGIPTASGFSMEEFEQVWKLYNRTMIRPVQRRIADAYDKIYGRSGVLTIKPFSLASEGEQNVN